MPRNRLTLTVRIGREVDAICRLHRFRDGSDVFAITFNNVVLHCKLIFSINRAILRNKIAHMAVSRQYLEIATKIFLERFRF